MPLTLTQMASIARLSKLAALTPSGCPISAGLVLQRPFLEEKLSILFSKLEPRNRQNSVLMDLLCGQKKDDAIARHKGLIFNDAR